MSGCISDPRLPDTGGGCCIGADVYGPERCTCWTPVYDLDQTDPDALAVRLLAGGVTPTVRPAMCADCAYRPTSPEKRGDPEHAGDAEFLESIAASGTPFWCHDGMRRPTAWRHPSGAQIPGHDAAYAPPIVTGVPYRANGQPGYQCAGWDARRRALAPRAEPHP